jgi:hypothetical protein
MFIKGRNSEELIIYFSLNNDESYAMIFLMTEY